MRRPQYLLILVVIITIGCRSNYLYDDENVPFVQRQLAIEVRHFDTEEPMEGVKIKRIVVRSIAWRIGHHQIEVGVDQTASNGTVIVDIDRPGMAIVLEKEGYWNVLLQKRSATYMALGPLLTEHQRRIVVPMRLFGKPAPLHPEWLSDDFKLPLPGKRK